MKNYDAVVIGAGVIGACTTLELARSGRTVLCVDKGPEAGYGSTSGSCAIVRTYYSTIESCALAYEGWFVWKDWSGYLGAPDESGHAVYHDTGVTCMKTQQNGFLARTMAIMDEIGCPYDELTPDDVREKFAGIALDRFFPAKRRDHPDFGEPTGDELPGAVFFSRGGYVSDPKLTAHNAQRAAEAAGATFRFRTAVTDVLIEDGACVGVKLDDGSEVRAHAVVNVAGPHSSRLNAMAGVTHDMTITTRPMRHEVAHVPAPEGYMPEGGFVSSDSDICAYMRSAPGGHILIGSEDPECDGHSWVDDPDDFDESHTDLWSTYVMRAGQRVPAMGVPNQARGVVALYDTTEDWTPIYDRSSLPGWYMACGTSGNQFKNAPTAGRIMTAIVDATERGHDHDADPIRFRLPNLDREIGLQAYSRRRELNADSSFSVLG